MPEQVTFDHYELLTRNDGSPFELGRGAMGITYKAYDTNLRIPVALKVINAPGLQDAEARNRFVQEARAAAQLRHRHVASVFHLGVQGESYFYAMEFIDGETVEALLNRRGPLPELVALRLALQVSRALHAASQQKLVHRDIKPSNIMLVHEDEELCAKVIDFGLAKVQLTDEESAALRAHTTSAGFLGTPHYASPEQLEEKEIDGRSDIYSLGATLWFMLAGEPPFSGPMARVISQHLSAEPPFEHLGGCSPAVIALLRRMLAKDPAARFSTALELRQAIEAGMESLAGGPAAAAARLALEESKVAPPIMEREDGDFAAGAVIAERYEVLSPLGATNLGWAYHAREIASSCEMRLLLLDSAFSQNRENFTQLEQEVETLKTLQHPNLLRVHGLETVNNNVLVALEWTHGVTLLEILRSRRKLEAEEVLRLLEPMAAGVEHAVERGVVRFELALHQVHVEFDPPLENHEAALRTPVLEWPRWEVKINPLAITREFAQSATWTGGQTLVGGGMLAAAEPENPGPKYTRELALLAYELLGGAVSPLIAARARSQGMARYTPLANLTEEGNDILRRALDPARSFGHANEFYRELAAVDLPNRGEKTSDEPKDPMAVEKRPSAPSAQEKVRRAQPKAAQRKKPAAMLFALGLILAAAAAAYLWYGRPQPKVEPAPEVPAPATTEPSPPVATEPVPPSTPAPQATPPPPPPAPTPRELLQAAIAEAEGVQAEGDAPKAVGAWLAVAREFPDAEIGRMRLELLLDGLRSRAAEMPAAERAALEDLLREAAERQVVSAMMMLGDFTLKAEPKEAFGWFTMAADQGVPAAMTKVGLMLANGTGTEPDLTRAAEFFQHAADKGDAAGKTALGECYLLGKGVPRDLEKAIDLLQQAAARSNVRALSRLGTCYHQGVGVKQDFAEAMRFFTKAAALGSGESLGNIGVLYMNGDGVPKNPGRAVEYFLRGAQSGDGYCMYLYARCFENGTGVTANPDEARKWYRKAAEAGIRAAIEWCKKNNVPL